MTRPVVALVAALLMWLSLATSARALDVRVDPRVEFVAALCRLAGFEEYQGTGFPAYDAAVDAHFAAFRDHPAMAEVRALREDIGLSYNMPIELALATGEGDWTLRLPAGDPANGLDARWTPEGAARFLAAARSLWTDAGAADFFAGQAAFHREVEASLAEGLARRLDLAWFERQYGATPGRSYRVVPGLLNGPHSYGPLLVTGGDRSEAYAVLGTPTHAPGDAPAYPLDQAASLIVHEAHHPHVNPWVARHAARLEPGASALFAHVGDAMRAAAYGRWDYMLNESLVRAQVLRYYRSRGAMPAYWRNLQDDRARGFAWVDALADALDAAAGEGGAFDARAEAAAFDFFERWGADPAAMIADEDARQAGRLRARRATGVQIVSASPALEGARVAPGEGELRLAFDRPMAGVGIDGDLPEVTGPGRWEEAGRVLVVPVRFAPGREYVLRLNDEIRPGQGFVGRDGEWLVPRTWRFRVDGDAPAR